jgi:signal transduction histidine kinase
MTSLQWRRPAGRELLAAALTWAVLFCFVASTYGLVVLGGGSLLNLESSSRLALSVLATALVALSFDRAQAGAEAIVARAVRHGRPLPYEVLRGLTSTLGGSHAVEELPARIARVLTEATGTTWCQVWLMVDHVPVLAATWPPRAVTHDSAVTGDGPVPGRRSLPVRQGGELLGIIVVQEQEHVALTTVEERLFAGLADQAGLGLRGARLHTELGLRAAELLSRAGDLQRSRERLVDVQDHERRQLERNIHDGAQQHLVALAVNLRLAQSLLATAPDRAHLLLDQQGAATTDAIDTLVDLSSGIYPPALSEKGLTHALGKASARSAIPVRIAAQHVDRYPPALEAAAYFVCLEALQNAAKHSGAEIIHVTLTGGPGQLKVLVEDDGIGFDRSSSPDGHGLTGMSDRIEALGGTLTTESAPGSGTRVGVRLPVPLPDDRFGGR